MEEKNETENDVLNCSTSKKSDANDHQRKEMFVSFEHQMTFVINTQLFDDNWMWSYCGFEQVRQKNDDLETSQKILVDCLFSISPTD